jgi:preprotein translocase subunit SecG
VAIAAGTLRRDRAYAQRKDLMLTVLILIHLMVVVAMIGVVLLQRSEGGGLGVGQAGGFLSSRGTANVLTRTTAILAGAFFATSLALSIVAGWDRKPQSILQNTGGPPVEQTPSTPETVPPSGNTGGRGILDQLQKPRPPENQPPTRPSGSQTPQSR